MNSTTSFGPPVISAAIKAMDAHDPHALAALFVEHGSVQDDYETHTGRAAIRHWFDATPATRLELLWEEHSATEYILTARAHGDYAGSPLSFKYSFALDGDLLRTLKITLL